MVAAERSLLTTAGHTVDTFEMENPRGGLESTMKLIAAPWNPLAASALKSKLAEEDSLKPTLAHVHNTWFAMSPSVISVLKAASIPVVMTVHNYRLVCLNAQLLRQGRPCELCVGTHPWRGVAYSCYRNSMPASAVAAGTIVVNRWLRTWDRQVGLFLVLTHFMQEIIERSGISPDRIALVPNFVADPGPRQSRPADSDVVLFVGRLVPEKGIQLLIEAWDRVRPASLQLVIVGEGPLRGELERRSVPGVQFRGQLDREHLLDLMLNSRALAFPSIWYEGQSMVLLEALAAGLPVLANNLGGIGETIGQGGRLVQDWDDALRGDLLDSGSLDALSRAARARWSDLFSPVGHLSAMLAAYAKVTHLQNDGS